MWTLVRSIAVLLLVLTGAAGAQENPFLPAQDAAQILDAIAAEEPGFVPPAGVTGISVPHHLLAADLIARGFWAASAGEYSRIVVLAPDHFHAVDGAFATTGAPFDTVLGPVPADVAAVEALAASGLAEMHDTMRTEHGVMALMPFIRAFFPDVPVVAVLASVNARPDDWRAMAKALAPLLTPDTLVVQSTDYSHYRSLAEAIQRDQETLAMLAAGDPEGVLPLLQPGHMDSKAAQFMQMTLQREVFGAQPVVLANANSAEYGGSPGATTSYIVSAWHPDPGAGTVFTHDDAARWTFGGDTLLGRYLLPVLRDSEGWRVIRDGVLAATGGAPLVLNLEGVLLDEPVSGVDTDAHVMVSDDAAPMLAAIGARAASLANNHANDLGPTGLAESRRVLDSLDLAPVGHREVIDLGPFRLLAINFVGGRFIGDAIADPEDLDWVCEVEAAPPLVAFVHWGKEYVTEAGERERAIGEALARCGVSLVVGAHSHRAAAGMEPLAGGAAQMVFSLGNLVFDQSARRASSAVLEVRVFRQGTLAARLVPLPNLFDAARATLTPSAPGGAGG